MAVETVTPSSHFPPNRVRSAGLGVFPDSGDTAGWTAALVAEIAGRYLMPGDVWDGGWVTGTTPTGPPDRDELVATYSTCDPDVLRAGFALAEDVEAAERYAARTAPTAA